MTWYVYVNGKCDTNIDFKESDTNKKVNYSAGANWQMVLAAGAPTVHARHMPKEPPPLELNRL